MTALLSLPPQATAATDSSADSACLHSPYRLQIAAFYRHKMPLQELTGTSWGATDACGIALRFPSGLPHLSVQLQADIAALSRAEEPSPDIALVELDLLAVWTGSLPSDVFGLDVGGGLTSAMIFVGSTTLTRHLFAMSESEFGFQAVLQPFVRVRRWRVGVPVSFVWILSAPHRFAHVDAGVSTAWEF
ncbi:MAG: hypothetical protein GF331_22585 [Chitinivibrionales bacterium]|nr:hypothetical protein [Chitinivibrionales bacterium]